MYKNCHLNSRIRALKTLESIFSWLARFIVSLACIIATVAVAAPSDLSGDGKSDLIFRNSSTGEINAWLMNGGTVTANLGLVGAGNWSVSHTADFNGDGKADILFRNDDGSVTLWLMNGLTPISQVGLLGADANWRVTHVGDFNGDGKADLLWQNTNGAVTLWLMNGATIVSQVGLLGPDPGWKVTHVADFNGDGKADLLWQNTNGAVTIWLMNGGTTASAVGILGANPDWRVTHTGDLNGDGKADLLWRNTNGAVTGWLMNGTTIASTAGLLGADANWSISHTGDFNGDGKADLLWRNTNGAVTQWLMNGTSILSTAGLLGPDVNWRVTHIGDYNGDGKADIVWRNAADGSIRMWLINGSTISSQTQILGASPWVVLPPVFAGEPTPRKIFGTADNCVDDVISTNTMLDLDIDRASALVAYWGDPGTDELNFQVSNPVTWNVETILNMPNPTKKRGYWDIGSPIGTSAAVVKCNEAGFFLNTFQFTHTQPQIGGGPQAQLKKKVSYPKVIFTTLQSDLIIQGYVKHPSHHWNDSDANVYGDISLYYYVQPINCPNYIFGKCPAANVTNKIPAFAHLLGVYNSRFPNGAAEGGGNDTFTGYFYTPLSDQLPNGAAPKYAKKSQFSYPFSGGSSIWSDSRFFRAEISYAKMQLMINAIRADYPDIAAQTTSNPAEWGIVLVGGLLEVGPGITATDGSPCVRNTNKPGCRDIVMSATFSYIEAYERIPIAGISQSNAVYASASQDPKVATPLEPKSYSSIPQDFSAERIRALLR
jgi:FG-GAP-like repeat